MASKQQNAITLFIGSELPSADSPEATAAYRILAYVKSARSPATQKARLSDLRDAARVLRLNSAIALFDLSPELIASYRDRLTELGQAPSTIARKIGSLRGLFSYAIKRRWTERNPADSALVSLSPVPKESLSEWLTKDEARRILSTCDRGTVRGLRDYAILTVLFYHGLRREELVSLTPGKPADWNARRCAGYFASERHHIVLTIKGKGGKVRRHPVKPSTLEAIEDYLFAAGRTMKSTEPLFHPCVNNRTGVLRKAITPEGVAAMIRKRCKLVGLAKRITPHSLRHSSATFALDAGGTVRKVADFLGHADVRTTMLYDRQRENLDDNASLFITL